MAMTSPHSIIPSALTREAAEIQWGRFDSLVKEIQARWMRGCPKKFEQVIRESCPPGKEPLTLQEVKTNHIRKMIARCGDNLLADLSVILGCSARADVILDEVKRLKDSR